MTDNNPYYPHHPSALLIALLFALTKLSSTFSPTRVATAFSSTSDASNTLDVAQIDRLRPAATVQHMTGIAPLQHFLAFFQYGRHLVRTKAGNAARMIALRILEPSARVESTGRNYRRRQFHDPAPKIWTGEAKKIDERKHLAGLSIAMPPSLPRVSGVASALFATPDSALLGRDPAPFLDPLARLNTARDADAFYWRTGKNDASNRMELECENWRHQRAPEDFPFEIGGSDAQSIEGLVTGTLSAANMTTASEIRLPVRIAFVDQPVESIAEQMVAEFERLSPRWRKAQKIIEPRDTET